MRHAFFGRWPSDWPLIWSALGQHHGWSLAELEALTLDKALFWARAMVDLQQERDKAQGNR